MATAFVKWLPQRPTDWRATRRAHLDWIRTRCFAAFVVLAFLAFGGWALQRHQSLKGSGDAKVISLAGRQGMLTQRIAFLAVTLPDASVTARPAARRRLLESTDLMRRSGRFLRRDGRAWHRPASQLPSSAFERRVARYLGAAEAFARTPHGGFAFPVLVHDRVVAIVEFFSQEVETVEQDLIEVMEHLGAQLGRVIERDQAADELNHQAGHDALTGLPNRALLLDRLVNAVSRSQRSATAVGVLFVDVDRFKALNDSLGHTAGDDLIAELGRRLDGLVRDSDTVGRFGGDEFVVLCDALDDEAAVLSLANRIAAACGAPVELAEERHEASVSVGVAVGRGAGSDAGDLIRDADLAVHRAKELGGGRIELFDPDLRAASDERTRLETALRRAVEEQALELAFQPLVDIDSGALAGFEALVRWTDPELGMISPAVFVPVAESTGLIHELGSFVLEQACSEAASWSSPTPLQINVNLSARQVADPEIVERVRGVLARTGLEPARLGLELTETALLEQTLTTVETLTRLKALGITLILDDFGAGYSSLGHLRGFPIDEVKIDRSFVMRMEDVAADRAIVAATVGLAASLGLGTVAEGVETQAQLEALHQMGCAKAQGYLLDRPLDASAARARIGAEHMVTAAKVELGTTVVDRVAHPESTL